MRILIISLPRTGSTSLLKNISKSKKLKEVFEPFDGTNRYTYNVGMKRQTLISVILI